MKKTIKNFGTWLAIAMIAMMTSVGAYAQDCGQAVDELCSRYDAITEKLRNTPDFQQLVSIDFTSDLESATNATPQECGSYELTEADKNKIQKSIDSVIITVVDKADEFTGGAARAQLEAGLNPLLDDFHKALKESKTLGDFITYMNEG